MTSTLFISLVAALFSMGCQKASYPDAQDGPATYTVSSTSELKALSLKAGDTVVWKDGEYKDVKITFSAKGKEGEEVVLKAQTPGGVVFTGTSGIKLTGKYAAAEGFAFKDMDTSVKNAILTCDRGSENCRLSNISIDGTGTQISTVDTKWVNLYGRHHEVSHCTFKDKRNMGCLFVVWLEEGIVPEHTIAYNYFNRPYTHYDDNGKARNGQESIRIGTSDFSLQKAACQVYGNHFYNCHGEMAEIISNKSCDNVYTGNFFEDSKGTLTLRHGDRCVVRGNYFRSSGISKVGGVRIIGEDHLVEDNVMLSLTGDGYQSAICLVMGESNAALNGYWTVKNPVIRNNTVVNCKTGICINQKGRASQDTAPLNVLFQNNTIVCASTSATSVIIANPVSESEFKWEGNTIWSGKQVGTSLPTAGEKPAVKDYTEDINNIISKAGKQW